MDHDEAMRWLDERQARGIQLGLEKVRRLLAAVGDPHAGRHIIHVAGTNGKGTVTTLLADVLRRAGHRTGAYTSPHLVRFCERIMVDGQPIGDDAIAQGLSLLRPAVEALDQGDEHPTYFEIVTALALWHFAQERVDWMVLETGLGGRLDATNVVEPDLTIITNVARDHVAMLGDSPAEVAAEKAGIMKRRVPCITGCTGAALDVLKARSRELEVPMSILGEDYEVVPDVNGFRLLHPGGDAHFDLGLAGAHQLQNAALVVAAVEALRRAGHDIAPVAVAQALAEASMPGRLERFTLPGPSGAVDVLLDAAHNEAGAAALRSHLANLDWAGFDLIVGFQADKDWPRILDAWLPIAGRGWGVPLRSPRTLRPEHMADAFGIVPFQACGDAADALRHAIEGGGRRIVVAGSIWLVGEMRAVLTGQGTQEIHGRQ